MRYLSAPWRADYVRRSGRPQSCIFCEARRVADDRAAAVLLRGRHNFVLLNRYPYTPGHLMIAPNRHLAGYEASRPAERAEMAELFAAALRILRRAYAPQGFNAGMNLGQSAGAGITGHYHLHVVPRWTGDANFMPLIGATRVFIEDLDTTYQKLRPLFDREQRRRGRRGPASRRTSTPSR